MVKKTYYIGYSFANKAGSTIAQQIEVIGHNKAVAEAYLKHIKTSDDYLADNRHMAYIEWANGPVIESKGWPIVEQIKLHKPI